MLRAGFAKALAQKRQGVAERINSAKMRGENRVHDRGGKPFAYKPPAEGVPAFAAARVPQFQQIGGVGMVIQQPPRGRERHRQRGVGLSMPLFAQAFPIPGFRLPGRTDQRAEVYLRGMEGLRNRRVEKIMQGIRRARVKPKFTDNPPVKEPIKPFAVTDGVGIAPDRQRFSQNNFFQSRSSILTVVFSFSGSGKILQRYMIPSFWQTSSR